VPHFEQHLDILHAIVCVKQGSKGVLQAVDGLKVFLALYVFELELILNVVVFETSVVPYVVD